MPSPVIVIIVDDKEIVVCLLPDWFSIKDIPPLNKLLEVVFIAFTLGPMLLPQHCNLLAFGITPHCLKVHAPFLRHPAHKPVQQQAPCDLHLHECARGEVLAEDIHSPLPPDVVHEHDPALSFE
eukprot:UN3078